MNIKDIVKVCQQDSPVKVMGLEQIQIDSAEIGLKGSPTRVKRSFSPTPTSEVRYLAGTPTEMSAELISVLQELTLVKK